MMTPRQRVLAALACQPSDVVPFDIGGAKTTSINVHAYRRLLAALGLDAPVEFGNYRSQRTHMSEAVSRRLGSDVRRVLPDLIDMGVDAVNPVQLSAKDMDPRNLKREFGDKLCFWGGIDTQYILPFGTPDEVRQEVRQRIHELATGGGYVIGSVHILQPEVPPENIVAMAEAAREQRVCE